MSLYSITRATVHIPFDSADAAELSELLEDKARLHIAAKRLVAAVYDAQHSDCEECRNERIAVSWELCRVTPCPHCRRADYAQFMARLAREAEEECPPTLPTGERFADGLPEPWDLPADELLPDMVPVERAPYVADRSAYDPHDDRADIQPFERTTTFPWSER